MPEYSPALLQQQRIPSTRPVASAICDPDMSVEGADLDADGLGSLQGLAGNSWIQSLLAEDVPREVVGPTLPVALGELQTDEPWFEEEAICPEAGPAGLLDDARVAAALAEANKQLETGVLDWAVTDAEASAALNAITALPDSLQGRAIERLDGDTFDTLLHEVPDLDRTRFKALMDATHDPERKLRLWAEYHKARVSDDAALERLSTADEGSAWPWGATDAQDENRRLNDRREEIVSSTEDEVDDEVAVAMALLAEGALTEADVVELAARKQQEHSIEMRYNVNLTSEEGVRQQAIAGQNKGTKIAWSVAELDQVDTALGRMPEAHVKHNAMLKEIRREDVSPNEQDASAPRIGGDHGGGVVRIFDPSVNALFRHTDDDVELQDPSTAGPLTALEEALTHEVGHDVQEQDVAAYDRFREAAGWRDGLGAGALSDEGINAELIDALERGDIDQVISNGAVYEVDPYNAGPFGGTRYTAFNEHAIPSLDDGATPSRWGGDTWSYARTNSADHFAEAYMKAVLKPETLAHDLLDLPTQRVDELSADRDMARGRLDALQAQRPLADEADLAKAGAELQRREDALAEATRDQLAQKTQWDTLRSEVFHADVATEAATERLVEKGTSPDQIAEFQSKASRAATPEQVARIEAGY